MKKLSISIVNYNAGNFLEDCLHSLNELEDEVDFDVYVVDNASTDGSIEKAKKKFSNFNYILNKDNLGFGKAHNKVLKKIKSEYVLILNPDTRVPKGTISYLLKELDKDQKIGVITPIVEKENGEMDLACHRGFPTPKAAFMYYFLRSDKLYHMTDRDMTKMHEIDSAVGAFMIVRKKVLDAIGVFDEDYFLYGEDLDLCYRVKEAGHKVVFVPQVKAFHRKGISSGIKRESATASAASEKTKQKSTQYFYDVMKIFYKKHYEKKYPFFVTWMVYLGIDMKNKFAKRSLRV